MRIEAKTYRENYLLQVLVAERQENEGRLVESLEACLIELCKRLDVSPPLWMDKNTREFARWRQTVFHAEQFMEEVPFSRLQIQWLEEVS